MRLVSKKPNMINWQKRNATLGRKKMYMAHFQIEKKVLVTENTIIYTPQLNTKIKHKFNIYIYSTIKKTPLKSEMSGHHKNQYRPFHHWENMTCSLFYTKIRHLVISFNYYCLLASYVIQNLIFLWKSVQFLM